jgi:hypothetical protein
MNSDTTMSSQATQRLIHKTWSRLCKEIKQDRLFVFCMALDELTEDDRLRLYKLLNKDLDERILTKKKEVDYDVGKGQITGITNIDGYISRLRELS